MPVTPAPLDRFPAEMRERIEELASAPTPPPKWVNLAGAQILSRAWYEWHIRRGGDPLRNEKRQRPSAYVRRLVLERDGTTCQICGDEVDPTDIHLDHIMPVALGGGNKPENLRVTHSRCNLLKGARL